MNLTQDTGSFKADVAGEIELGIYMGMWRDEYGTLATGPELYARLQGHLDVLLIAWREDPMQALPSLIRVDAAPWFVANEIARLAAPITSPAGWRYLVETGHADIFTEARDASGKRLIKLDSRDDQGIICTPVDRALTPSTRISWRWRVTAQPSVVAEDTVRTHDYISIAAEFDNGRDLTWIWSATLAPEHHFHCPVKAWTARETHFVVRTGTEHLGQWCAEVRNIYDDVAAAMGPPPQRIVRIWLIGVSSFQHGVASAEFADIALHDAAGRRPVN